MAPCPKEALERIVWGYHDRGEFNGTVLVARAGSVIMALAVGEANAEWHVANTLDTKMRIASLSKQFTAGLILQLVHEGRVDVHGKISDYLDFFAPGSAAGAVTIHQLLTHTSGIPDYADTPEFFEETWRNPHTPRELITQYCQGELEFAPGSMFKYCSSNYLLLAAIIEKVTGVSYEQALRARVLGPLGMADTGCEDPDRVIFHRASGYKMVDGVLQRSAYMDMSNALGSGSVYSTVLDLLRWENALSTDRLIPEELRSLMFTPYVPAWDGYYGYGWKITIRHLGGRDRTVVGHGGGMPGFNASTSRIPEDRTLVVVLSNLRTTKVFDLGKDLLRRLYGDDVTAAPDGGGGAS